VLAACPDRLIVVNLTISGTRCYPVTRLLYFVCRYQLAVDRLTAGETI